MIVIPETAAERDLLWRRRDALRRLLPVPLAFADRGGEALELGQEPAERLQAVDRTLRRFLLLHPEG